MLRVGVGAIRGKGPHAQTEPRRNTGLGRNTRLGSGSKPTELI